MPGTQTEQEKLFWENNYHLRAPGEYGISPYCACAMHVVKQENPERPEELISLRELYAKTLANHAENGALIFAFGSGGNPQTRFELHELHQKFPEGQFGYVSSDNNQLAAQDAENVLEWNKAVLYHNQHIPDTLTPQHITDQLKSLKDKGIIPPQIILTFVHSVYSTTEDFATQYTDILDAIKTEGYSPDQILTQFIFINEHFDPARTKTEIYPLHVIPLLQDQSKSYDGPFLLQILRENLGPVALHGIELNQLYPNKADTATWKDVLTKCGTPIIDQVDAFFGQTTIFIAQGQIL